MSDYKLEPVESELLPCPFCGAEPERVTLEEGENYGGDAIVCRGCLACSRVVFGEKEGLIEAWNKRPAPAVQEEPVAYISHTSEGDILGWERQFDAPSHTPLYLTPHPADQQPAPTWRFTKETHDENYQQ